MSSNIKRESRREKRQQQQRRQNIRVLLVVVGIVILIVAGIVYANTRPIGEVVEITPRNLPNPDGLTLGDPAAPVVIEVYEDFQCPVCRNFTETIEPSLLTNYVETGKALFIFRHYPFIGSESFAAANASMCANEQGRFWDYHDLLFANQTGENVGAFSNRRLQAFGETLGLNMDDFRACFSASEYDDLVKEDRANGLTAGVEGTPTVFVDGQKLPNFSYATIQSAIELALATGQ